MDDPFPPECSVMLLADQVDFDGNQFAIRGLPPRAVQRRSGRSRAFWAYAEVFCPTVDSGTPIQCEVWDDNTHLLLFRATFPTHQRLDEDGVHRMAAFELPAFQLSSAEMRAHVRVVLNANILASRFIRLAEDLDGR